MPLRANKSQSVIIISYNFAVSILNKEQTAVRRILLFGNNDDKIKQIYFSIKCQSVLISAAVMKHYSKSQHSSPLRLSDDIQI